MNIRDFLEQYDNGNEFTEKELEDIILGCQLTGMKWVEESEGESRRWTKAIIHIGKIEERYFEFQHEEGLTEYQDSSFDNQPVEVSLTETKRTIEVIDRKWEKL